MKTNPDVLCRNCHKPIPPKLVADGADACSLACVREFVIRGRGRLDRPGPRQRGPRI